ncbi:hypothetical protein F2P56_018831 [Juglans regia]|uniref:Reverse transcriptase Ty1/copia-type domain-containing protein n=1 Tax=Juglans regia TaxID=51240 RepID=A0A833U5T2_JUGRE|nr:hypothetical protein F2P56_018831 [Juglans regia]
MSTASPNWFPDTATSTHFTSDFSKLNLESTPYLGPDQVTIGDGSSLGIQNSGSDLLSTSFGNFLLHQLLHDLNSQEASSQINQSSFQPSPSEPISPSLYTAPSVNLLSTTLAHEPITTNHHSLDSSPSPENTTASFPANPNSLLHPGASSSSIPSSTNLHPMTTRSKALITRPLQRQDGSIPWPPLKHSASLTTHSSIPDEPTSYTEASKFSIWHTAMASEFEALLRNDTWTLVPPHPNQNLLGSKCVLKTKRLADGTIEQCKARLVAKGFHQQAGLDYSKTFSPVVKLVTIRLLFSITVSRKWPLHQLDIRNAFLHRDLEEDVFIQQPTRWEEHLYRLLKPKLSLPLFCCVRIPSLMGLLFQQPIRFENSF